MLLFLRRAPFLNLQILLSSTSDGRPPQAKFVKEVEKLSQLKGISYLDVTDGGKNRIKFAGRRTDRGQSDHLSRLSSQTDEQACCIDPSSNQMQKPRYRVQSLIEPCPEIPLLLSYIVRIVYI